MNKTATVLPKYGCTISSRVKQEKKMVSFIFPNLSLEYGCHLRKYKKICFKAIDMQFIIKF